MFYTICFFSVWHYCVFLFSDVEALAALLKRFLGLEELQQRLAEDDSPDEDDIEDLGLGDSSDSKEEDEL